MKRLFLYILITQSLSSCEKLLPGAPDDDEILDGPVEGLTQSQTAQFLRGDIAFNDDIFTPATGLGPAFVASSCGSCHAGDGKGHPSTTLTRFGQSDTTGNVYLHLGGPQLQNLAIPGHTPETLPAGAPFSKFTPPANTGLGFLERVSDADLLALADPTDANGDGISGVANWKTMSDYLQAADGAVIQNGKYVHRFGKKAGAYNLLQQTVNAYNQDMGITSHYSPYDAQSGVETEPEVSLQKLNDLVFYLQTLKAPIQRDADAPEIIHGKNVFMQTGCGNCHQPSLKTGYSPVDALSFKTFYPYTDLLLHDMGPGLDDGYTEGSALTSEWRTPALWGLGLSPNSQGGEYFLLHDGRAKSIEEAILYHGGEAEQSKNQFLQLTASDKEQLLKFLESL